MIRLMILCLLVTDVFPTSWGESLTGEGRFYAHEKDSLGFVKKQLLMAAFRNVIDKELKAMNLDSELFWKKLDVKFEEYFSKHHEALKKKYGITEDEDVKKKTLNAFKKALRKKRLHLKSQYGRLSKAVSSYSIKKRSGPSKRSKSRYLSVQAKVNRKVLNRIYFRFTRDDAEERLNNVYFSVHLQLENGEWQDLGVEESIEFTKIVEDHWKTWLKKNLKNHVDNVSLANEAEIEKMQGRLQIAASSIGVDVLQDDSSSELASIDEDLQDSLWLKINVQIKKKLDEPLLGKRTFVLDGDFILIDLKFGSSVYHYDFISVTHKNDTRDTDALKSTLAGQVYRMPLNRFSNVGTALARLSQKKDQIKLQLENIKTVRDLFSFKDILTKRGLSLRFAPEIISYKRNSGVIGLSYGGKKLDVINFLRSMKNQKVGNNSVIGFKNKDNPFSLYLIRRKSGR